MRQAEELFFREYFPALSGGRQPYPWQEAFFDAIIGGSEWPDTVSMPTGAGKTAIMKIWLIALAWSLLNGKSTEVPRRLFWVVNRRVVVDQTTDEAEDIKAWLETPTNQDTDFYKALRGASLFGDTPLAVSKLRGEVDDNREWSRDPLTPAIVVGTVDIIGSRLLFRGYRNGPYYRSKDAGLLGVDSLIVNDEAHLTPAFATLLKNIESLKPTKGLTRYGQRFRVLLVSATERGAGNRRFNHDLELDLERSESFRRIYRAEKRLWLEEVATPSAALEAMARIALEKDVPRTIIFVEGPEDAAKLAAQIEKKVGAGKVALLTGTMRGYERIKDQESGDVFRRFRQPETPEGRWFLVTTSAGEVGVNMTSEVLLTALVESDRLLQRFGRLNRFGDQEGEPHKVGNAHVFAIVPKGSGKASDLDGPKQKTLEYLRSLERFDDGSYDISCEAVTRRPPGEESRSKAPLVARLEPWHIELWSLTSAPSRLYGKDRKLLAAMPDVDSWLHGKQDGEPPETSVAWREEVKYLVTVDKADRERALDLYRVLAHEKISEPTVRIIGKLKELIEDGCNERVLFQNRDGDVEALTLKDLANWSESDLKDGLLLLPPGTGKLFKGMWKEKAGEPAGDVAEKLGPSRRRLVLTKLVTGEITCRGILSDDGQKLPSATALRIELPTGSDDDTRVWLAFDVEKEHHTRTEIELDNHLESVGATAGQLSAKSASDLQLTYIAAGLAHDTGKRHERWQRAMGGSKERPLAKTKKPRNTAWLEGFRHELRSVLDLKQSEVSDDLLVHLVASHHGWARPYWEEKAYDPDDKGTSREVAREAVERFARLQKTWGPWGLAYLEALMKSADGLMSEEPNRNGA